MTNLQQTLFSTVKNWKYLLRSGARHGCPLSPLLFNITLKVLVTAVREEKEIKGIQISEDIKLSLFEDDMILYMHVCMLGHFSHVWLCATLWTAACKVPLSMGFQARILEWVAMPLSRRSSWPRDQTCVFYIHLHWLASPRKPIYMENPKDSTRKLLELITEYSQVAGYTFNTHKSLVFLITNSEKSEREVKETILLTTAEKRRRKYLWINLPK